MANNFSSNPMTVDTVMATPFNSNVKVSMITWTKVANAGDRCLIIDFAGNQIYDSTAYAANYQDNMSLNRWVHGFQVTVLDSGEVTIGV